MVVGLNSDSSIKKLDKGPNRPINAEYDRAYLLAALEFVDGIIIFHEETPEALINEIRPNVLVKGGDYDPNEVEKSHPKYIMGRDVVLKNGAVARGRLARAATA